MFRIKGMLYFLFITIVLWQAVVTAARYEPKRKPSNLTDCTIRHDINGNTHTGCNLFTVRESKNE